jgi:hypothetical protein
MLACLVTGPLDQIADIATIDAKVAGQVPYVLHPGMVQKCTDYSKRRAMLTSK